MFALSVEIEEYPEGPFRCAIKSHGCFIFPASLSNFFAKIALLHSDSGHKCS